MTTETYYYHGINYTWHHEPQNEYQARHIRLYDCVQAINDCPNPQQQDWYKPARWKYIGTSSAGIITVITAEVESHIITAWQSSTAEVKEWLKQMVGRS